MYQCNFSELNDTDKLNEQGIEDTREINSKVF